MKPIKLGCWKLVELLLGESLLYTSRQHLGKGAAKAGLAGVHIYKIITRLSFRSLKGIQGVKGFVASIYLIIIDNLCLIANLKRELKC
jgi:hypothetical protein